MPMESAIQHRRLQQGFLAVLGALAVYVCYVIVRPFLLPAAAATALAVAFYPVVSTLRKRMRRSAAAALALLLIVVLIVTPLVLLSIGATQELRQLFSRLSQRSAADGGWELYLTHVLSKPLSWLGMDPNNPEFSLRAVVTDWVDAASASLVRAIRSVITNIAGTLLDLVVALFTLFFLLRDGDRLLEQLKDFVPLDRVTVDLLLDRVNKTIIANMYGVVAVGFVQGGLTGLAFWVLSLPNPILYGMVAGLLSMVPLLGASSVWVVTAISLVVAGNYSKAAMLAAFGAGVIGLADNFIRPYVVSGQVKLHPLLVFFALLGGARAFGLVGIFIGPAVLSVTIALLEILRGPSGHVTLSTQADG